MLEYEISTLATLHQHDSILRTTDWETFIIALGILAWYWTFSLHVVAAPHS